MIPKAEERMHNLMAEMYGFRPRVYCDCKGEHEPDCSVSIERQQRLKRERRFNRWLWIEENVPPIFAFGLLLSVGILTCIFAEESWHLVAGGFFIGFALTLAFKFWWQPFCDYMGSRE